MVVGELALVGGGLEDPVGIEADARDLRKPMRQHGEVGVPVGSRCQLVEQRCPFGDGGGEVVDDAPIEAGLPTGLDGRELPFAGGSRVGGGSTVRGAPHGEVGDGGGVRTEGACRRPRRELGGRQRLVAHLIGEFDHECVTPLQVVAPVVVPGEASRESGQPREGSGLGVASGGGFEAPVDDGCRVGGAAQLAGMDGSGERTDRVGSGRRDQQQVGAERGPRRSIGKSGDELVGCLFEALDEVGACGLFGGVAEGVAVAGDGLREQVGRVREGAGGGGGGGVVLVAGEDAPQEVGGGRRDDRLGPHEGVGVAVADDFEVDMVGVPAAGQHRVQLLAGLGAGSDAVQDVGGDALGAVDGARVAEFDRLGYVAGGQDHGLPVGLVDHAEVPVGRDAGDGPAVAVADPVSARGAQPAVVQAGDDDVADRGIAAVGERHGARGVNAVVEVGLGAGVEFGDQRSGGGDHEGVGAGVAGGEPGVEDLVGAGAEVADVDAVVVEVEAERFGVAGAEREAGGAFGRVGEADELVELDGAVGGLDVAEDAAGADRGELLVVADEAHGAAAVEDELDDLVQRESVGHAGLVDDDEARRPDAIGPRGQWTPVVQGVGEEGHRVGVGVDLGAQLGGRGG